MNQRIAKQIVATALALGATGFWAPKLLERYGGQLGLPTGANASQAEIVPAEDALAAQAPLASSSPLERSPVRSTSAHNGDGDGGNAPSTATSTRPDPGSPESGGSQLEEVARLVAALRGLGQPAVLAGSAPVQPEAVAVQREAIAAEPPTPDPAPVLEDLPLRGVLVREAGPRALLGSHLVAPGDTLLGGRLVVVSIEPGSVRIELDRVAHTLELPAFRARPRTPGSGGASGLAAAGGAAPDPGLAPLDAAPVPID